VSSAWALLVDGETPWNWWWRHSKPSSIDHHDAMTSGCHTSHTAIQIHALEIDPEVERVIIGERGSIDDNEFPLDVPKDGEA
jgi:hypothetical protein